MNDPDIMDRYARITTEAFHARYIADLLHGPGLYDERPGRKADRRHARTLMRQHGWELQDVVAFMENVKLGITVVPRPPAEAMAKAAARGKRASKVGAMFGRGGDSSFEKAVNDWKFIARRNRVPAHCTPDEARVWIKKIRSKLRGGALEEALDAAPEPTADETDWL